MLRIFEIPQCFSLRGSMDICLSEQCVDKLSLNVPDISLPDEKGQRASLQDSHIVMPTQIPWAYAHVTVLSLRNPPASCCLVKSVIAMLVANCLQTTPLADSDSVSNGKWPSPAHSRWFRFENVLETSPVAAGADPRLSPIEDKRLLAFYPTFLLQGFPGTP